MPSDYSDETSDTQAVVKEQPKLSPGGMKAMQGEVEDIPEPTIDTTKIPQEQVQQKIGRDSLWTGEDGSPVEPKGTTGRGADYEKLKDANIGGNFETIDDFKDGTATSYKTIDLNAPSYDQNPAQIKSTMFGYIDDLADFPGAVSNQKGKRVEVLAEDIQQKNLCVGVPVGSLHGSNTQAMADCGKYAQSKNVNLLIDEVP